MAHSRKPLSPTDVLRKDYVYLKGHLDSWKILDFLYQERVLDRPEYNRLIGIHRAEDRNMALIEKMEQKSWLKFRIFLLSLEKYQAFVMDHLEEKIVLSIEGLSLRKEFQVDSEIQSEEEDSKEQSLKRNTDHEARLKILEQTFFQTTHGGSKQTPTLNNEGNVHVKGVVGGYAGTSNTAGSVLRDMINSTTNIRIVKEKGQRNNVILQALKLEKQELQNKLTELEFRHKRQLTKLQSKGKELHKKLQTQGNESDNAKAELKGEILGNKSKMDKINMEFKKEIGYLKTNITDHEGRIKTLEKSQEDGPSSRECIEHQTRTYDEMIYKEQVQSKIQTDMETFFNAVRQGELVTVKRILSSGVVQVNCRENEGRTPVMVAAWYLQETIFDYLVQQNCDLLAVDDKKDTVLHYACLGGSVYIVEVLLFKIKLYIECRGMYGRTPLMNAVQKGHLFVVMYLKKKGADFNTVDDDNNKILHMACIGGHVDMVQYILSLNITDIECRGQYGRTPLMCAVEFGNLELVRFLQNKGADLYRVDTNHDNIIHFACIGGHVDMVQHVLSLNITDIECRGQYGRTPLMCAVEMGHLPVVELLKRKGADFHTSDTDSNKILHLACIGGHIDMVQYVLSLNITDIDCRGQYGRTPLMHAVEKGHLPLVYYLKRNGSNFKCVDTEKSTMLHVACIGGHLDMVKHLVTLQELRGVEKRKNKYENTSLNVARLEGHGDVVSFLMSRSYRT